MLFDTDSTEIYIHYIYLLLEVKKTGNTENAVNNFPERGIKTLILYIEPNTVFKVLPY